MLRGVKPLAVFGWIEGHEVEALARYLRLFDKRVSAGHFTKHEEIRPVPQLPHLSYYQVFYALPRQAWRIGAYLELLQATGPWTADRERRLGELLGYEDWQNDIHLQNFRAD
jgi:hypothetical protein